MLAITERIKFIEAPQKGKFPYCHCILIEDNLRVLIDNGCGKDNLDEIKTKPLDIMLNSHFHKDHTRGNHLFPESQLWAHPLDIPAMNSPELFADYYGIRKFGGEELNRLFMDRQDMNTSPVHHQLVDGEIMDFGHLRFRVIHTPGHTPGHCCFYEEESGFLYSGDIDLTRSGPWYAHACSDLDDFIKSIEKCIDLNPQIIFSSHKGVIKDNISGRLKNYRDVIFRKEEAILEALQVPKSLDELSDQQIVYSNADRNDRMIRVFEKWGVYQHLKRLIKIDKIAQNGELYYLK